MLERLRHLITSDPVLIIAWLLAVATAVVVPPDGAYPEYIDFHTLGLLFSLMAVMAGLQNLGLFRRMGERMLAKTSNTRQLELVLVFLPFFSSMLVTNDVALITFVPFALEVLRIARLEKAIIPVVAMQTIAANLGSMTTPIGNPQNLYLYSRYQLSLGAFFQTMLPLTAASGILIAVVVLLRKSQLLYLPALHSAPPMAGSAKRLVLLYFALFFVCLGAVAKWLEVWLVVSIVLACVVLADRRTLKQVDYALLFTFIGFFIFVGNLGRLEVFRTLFQNLLTGHEVLCAALVSQFISNVPAALLLSGFTQQGAALLTGVNLGGLGTLIASMASLISFKYISRSYPAQKGSYLKWFTVSNIAFFIILYGVTLIL